MKESGDTAGIRLVVHSQARMPFPEDEGITVSPGHSTSIGMRKVSTVQAHRRVAGAARVYPMYSWVWNCQQKHLNRLYIAM